MNNPIQIILADLSYIVLFLFWYIVFSLLQYVTYIIKRNRTLKRMVATGTRGLKPEAVPKGKKSRHV